MGKQGQEKEFGFANYSIVFFTAAKRVKGVYAEIMFCQLPFANCFLPTASWFTAEKRVKRVYAEIMFY
jgi:hypothetical protein